MRQFTYRIATIFASAALPMLIVSGAQAQIRTAPDIKTPKNYQPGTGVNRLGIMTDNTRPKVPTYRLPGASYYYGWYPRGSYYYHGSPYYDGYHGGYYDDYYYDRHHGRWFYPPVTADAGTLYGPRATRQFLGIDAGNGNRAASGGSPLRAAAAQAPQAPRQISNPTVRARAWKFVEYGDRHFQRGDYRKAVERYRKAESQADDIPDIYFRQGFAHMGAQQYAEAVSAMRKGLALNPDWPNAGFVLEELYRWPEAKREVFRQLHTDVHERPNDADAQFLLAVMQHFDGQTEAAEVRFRRVVELAGKAAHARLFLPLAPAEEEPDDDAENDGPLLPE